MGIDQKEMDNEEDNLCLGKDRLGEEFVGAMENDIERDGKGRRMQRSLRWGEKEAECRIERCFSRGMVSEMKFRSKSFLFYFLFSFLDVCGCSSFDLMIYEIK